MTLARSQDPFLVLDDARVATVLRRLHKVAQGQDFSIGRHFLPHWKSALFKRYIPFAESEMAAFYADKYIALEKHQAAFLYLTARALQAKTVVEFGTSFGLSTMWMACAVRANGGGRVVTTEIVPEKAAIALKNFEEAGLSDWIDLRVGDVLETLHDGPEDIDLLLNDGFPMQALNVVKLLTPRMRTGAVVLTDDVGHLSGNFEEYLTWIRDPTNGFRSTLIPFKGGTEYSVRSE